MDKIFCVEFQRYPLKFHTKYLTQTLTDVILLRSEDLRALWLSRKRFWNAPWSIETFLFWLFVLVLCVSWYFSPTLPPYFSYQRIEISCNTKHYPDSKAHRANMRPIWGRQDPGRPHVDPMNFVGRFEYHSSVCLGIGDKFRLCYLYYLNYNKTIRKHVSLHNALIRTNMT